MVAIGHKNGKLEAAADPRRGGGKVSFIQTDSTDKVSSSLKLSFEFAHNCVMHLLKIK
jgi:hypothetical protein